MSPETFASRTRVISLVLLGFSVLAGLRLFYLQIIRHGYYEVLASEEQRRKYEVPSHRGEIYLNDRGKSTPVALNRDLKTLYADPRYVTNRAEVAKQLASVTGDNAKTYEEAFASGSYYVVLKKQIEPALAAQISDLELPGIGLIEAPQRVYPEGSLAAQVLGFVNAEGNGQYGIEEYLNQELAGSKGLLSAKTDTRGIPIATSDNLQLRPVDGTDVVLTIDRNVQAKVEQVLKDGAARYRSNALSAVVMDPANGRVIAMANHPTFDPAKYQEVGDYNVFADRAATGLFEPGSVFKVFAMTAGLDSGAVTPTTPFSNTGTTQVADYTIKNAQGIPNGQMTMSDVLSKSVNTGMVQLLRLMGGGDITGAAKAKLHNYYVDRFKFGTPTGAEVPSEPGGLIAPADENDVTYANMTFGQGLTATMLQVAAGYSAIANGGTLYRPTLIDHTINAKNEVKKVEPEVRSKDIASAQTFDAMKPMLEAVVNSGGGQPLKVSGYRIGGKTGTAQIPNPAGGYFDNRDIGSFVGIITLNGGQYVVMVRVDQPAVGGFAGSAAAAPLVGEISKWLINYGGVAPGS